MVYESVAAREAREPREIPQPGSRARQAHLAAVSAQLDRFSKALDSLERAVAADPGLDEARLRQGRVLWHLGKGDEARAAFETVIERSREDTTLHLARMFLGRVHQDARREDQARREYRAALALQPTSQGAAIALADALQLAGEPEAARAVIEAALAAAGRRELPQSLWEYDYGDSPRAPELLRALRDEARS
jgi:tetratricopeptide (TPR) repeat protein